MYMRFVIRIIFLSFVYTFVSFVHFHFILTSINFSVIFHHHVSHLVKRKNVIKVINN